MIDEFEKTLGLSVFPESFRKIYDSSMLEFERDGTFFLNEQYLNNVLAKTGCFSRVAPETFSAAEAIRKDFCASRYALFLYRAMQNRKLFLENLKLVKFPEQYPFFAFLCLIPAAVSTYNYLSEKGIPEDVIKNTVGQYEECLFIYCERFDKLGMNNRYFNHLQRHVDNQIFNIGRLRFEIEKNKGLYVLEGKDGEQIAFLEKGRMNSDGLYSNTPPLKEDGIFDAFFEIRDDYFIGTPINENGRCENRVIRLDKNEYSLKLCPGDDCISVHIPSKGLLLKEVCDESYKRARELFNRHYPEFQPKAFVCRSWMMAPELVNILKPGSNLLSFQKPYKKYPIMNEGKDVLNFVFKMKFNTYEDLPEDTSLQRALKKIYLSGGLLYEYGGVVTI